MAQRARERCGCAARPGARVQSVSAEPAQTEDRARVPDSCLSWRDARLARPPPCGCGDRHVRIALPTYSERGNPTALEAASIIRAIHAATRRWTTAADRTSSGLP